MRRNITTHRTTASGGSFGLVIIGKLWKCQKIVKGGVDIYSLVSNALEAGFMIGYNTRKADEKDSRRKQKGNR